VPCANARDGNRTATAKLKTAFDAPRMVVLLEDGVRSKR
jgi:hypothetical protein